MDSSHRSLYPFGAPDGVPKQNGGKGADNNDDPLRDFVPFSGRQFRRGLGMDADDRRVRVIVGRKGAGKTLYLRRLQSAAESDDSLYADRWRIEHTPTSAISSVFDACSSALDAGEKWERIWRCAILRSVATHMMYDRRLRDSVDGEQELALREALAPVYKNHADKTSPYQEVVNLLYDNPPKRNLDSYIERPEWNTLEERITRILEACSPICFYLDAIDDHFERKPEKWLECQKGLCLQVIRMAHQMPHLHIVITVRDVVYSALKHSEHMTRNQRDAWLRTLDWNSVAIDQLLQQKVDKLPADYLLRPYAEDPIERWLGVDSIANSGKDRERGSQKEALKDYLLRHTRLIPRDLVQLGNALCEQVDVVAEDKDPFVSDGRIHATVRRVARDSGLEELFVVANHVTTEAAPPNGDHWDIGDAYWTDAGSGEGEEGGSWQHVVRDHLVQNLRTLREDRITAHKLKGFVQDVRPLVGRADILSILWRQGLLGYIDGDKRKTGRVVFYSATDESSLRLSLDDHRWFALHPIVIDTVGRPMRGVGAPVLPF